MKTTCPFCRADFDASPKAFEQLSCPNCKCGIDVIATIPQVTVFDIEKYLKKIRIQYNENAYHVVILSHGHGSTFSVLCPKCSHLQHLDLKWYSSTKDMWCSQCAATVLKMPLVNNLCLGRGNTKPLSFSVICGSCLTRRYLTINEIGTELFCAGCCELLIHSGTTNDIPKGYVEESKPII